MWLFNRRLALTGLFALCACGFTPVYGPGGSGAMLRDQVQIREPKVRIEFEFAKEVTRQLGRSTAGPLRLEYSIAITQENTVVSAAQEINRLAVTGTVKYTLTDRADTVLANGTTKAFTSFSATGSTLATDSAQRNAQDRLMVILANQMISQLVLDLEE